MTTIDTAQKDWTDLKGKIKSKWGKFTDTEVESFKGKMDLISEKIQKSYGITKEKADSEYKEFSSGLNLHKKDVEAPVVEAAAVPATPVPEKK